MVGSRILDETGDEDIKGPIQQMMSDKYIHSKRVLEIMSALVLHGFGKAWGSTTLLKDLDFDRKAAEELQELQDSVRFRKLLESLGPTFIKLGQMLSTRPDLIPEIYIRELSELRDDVPPFPFDQVKTIIEKEFETPIAAKFDSFDKEPVAAASIGQVHVATLKGTGEKVAVKIQRPNIKDIIKADIEILKNLASLLTRAFKSIENFDPVGAVEEFGHMITREIDYTIEARNIQRFDQNMKKIDGVIIPNVHWSHSTRKVLTMDFIKGVPMDDIRTLKRWKIDLVALTDMIGKAYIKQVFVDGFFHADPHQGNLFVLKGGKVCFLDFGAIGFLDDETRTKVGTFYTSLMRQEVGKAARNLMDLCNVTSKDVDIQKLEWDLRDFVDYNFLSRKNVKMAKGMNQKIVTIAAKHGFMLPSSFVLLERALLQIEGVARSLNPKFDIVELTQRNLIMLLRSRYKLDLDPIAHLETANQYRKFVKGLPSRADKVLKKIENDEFTIKVDTTFIDDFKHHIRKTVLILALGLIAASLILYVAWIGPLTKLGWFPASISVAMIIAIWAILAFMIHNRT